MGAGVASSKVVSNGSKVESDGSVRGDRSEGVSDR
jgi:hypothetical protein